MKMEQNNNLNMHLLLKMEIFHCHVSFRGVEIDVARLLFNANCIGIAHKKALQPSSTLPETNM